jgi:hypothetical protein
LYTINFSINGTNSTANHTVITINVTDIGPSLIATPLITLGGESQKRSNPFHNKKKEREVNVTGAITITNNGGRALRSLAATITPQSGFSTSDLTPQITITNTTLAIGESTVATLTMRIPEDLDSVDSALNEISQLVASVGFTAKDDKGNTTTASTNVNMKAKNMLEIDEAKITVDGEEEDLKENDNIDNLKPESEIDIWVKVENLFTATEDVEIEDIEVRIEIEDLDIDEDEELGDLDADDKDTVTLSFTLDDDVESGIYDGLLTVEGTDRNGATHGVKWELEFEVERKTHEIDIRSISLNPSTVSCEESAELRVSIRNIGERSEKEVTLAIESIDLNYGDVINFIELDEDDSTTKTFVIPVAKELSEGQKRITVSTFYKMDKSSDKETVSLNKKKCLVVKEEAPPAEEEVPEQVEVVVAPPQKEEEAVTGAVVAQPVVVEKPFTQTGGYIALLVLAYIVVIIGGIYLVGRVLKKS